MDKLYAKAEASSMNALGWDELADLSAQVRAAENDAAATALLVQNGLVTDAGLLDRDQAKLVELADGTIVRARLIGYRRGELAEGSLAGLAFTFADALATRGVSSTSKTQGGWKDCELRSWLNGDCLDLLPSKLSGAIKPALKVSYPSLEAVSAGNAERTQDMLWLLSESELAGWATYDAGTRDGALDEGAAYQLFEQSEPGSAAFEDAYTRCNPSVGTWTCWWERTIDPYKLSDTYLFRNYNGTRSASKTIEYGPNFELGVCPGFCV